MPTRPYASLLLVFGLLLGGRGNAQTSAPRDTAAPRAELPIKLVTLPDGARRYTVPVTIGGTVVETGLDTGSVGLRVLPGTLKPDDAKSTGKPDNMRYGGGAMYDGVVSTAMLGIAGLKGEATFQQVEKVGCAPRKPDCKAAKVALADYGIMGDGIPGAGFKAIMGVAAKEVNIDNPLRRLGVTRFIVDLPRGKDETGRLILNPTAADLEGFVAIPAYKRSPAQKLLSDDTVNGCIVAHAQRAQGTKICGALTFDSGKLGITVASPDALGEAWPAGTKASMVLDDGTGHALVTENMVIGSREDAAHLNFEHFEFMPKTVIRMGIAPYLDYSVLHDLEHGGLALRPRPPRA